jgi:hypothetical protein
VKRVGQRGKGGNKEQWHCVLFSTKHGTYSIEVNNRQNISLNINKDDFLLLPGYNKNTTNRT